MDFPAVVLHEDDEGIVVANLLRPSKPLIVDDTLLLDANYLGIWFCCVSAWHDVGAVYDHDNQLNGYYCDICTPITRRADGYALTDFFLDLWIYPDGRYVLLDEDEFAAAVTRGILTNEQRVTVQNELARLVAEVEAGVFPSKRIRRLLTLPENVDKVRETLQKAISDV